MVISATIPFYRQQYPFVLLEVIWSLRIIHGLTVVIIVRDALAAEINATEDRKSLSKLRAFFSRYFNYAY